MNKHTKGPWKIDGGKGKKGELYVWNNLNEPKGTLGSLEVCVATVNAGRVSPATIEANAALILAAPDLLAALEEIATHGDDDHPCDHDSITWCRAHIEQVARAAIAKAKGGEA